MVEGLQNGPLAFPVRAGRVEAAGADGTAPRAGTVAADVAVASEWKGLMRDMAARPPVDVARVETLAALIAEGRYTVDAERLADAMIAAERPTAR